MRKPLSEHDATLTSRKKAEPRPDPDAEEALEPVSGGRVRRIVFKEDEETWSLDSEPAEPVAEPDDVWDPEPVESAPEPASKERWPHADPAHHYKPRHEATIDQIHADIDNRILGRKPKATKTVIEEETIYETDKGAVRRSKRITREGRSSAIYIESEKEGRRVERRFNPAEVDRVVKGAPMEEADEKAGLFSRFRKEDKATKTSKKTAKPKTVKTTKTVTKTTKTSKAKTTKKPAKAEEVVAAPIKSTAAPALDASEPYYAFKGKEYPVRDIEGIGPQYAKRLHDLGVETTARLCYEDGDVLAKKMGIPAKTVKGWQAMAQLVKINGVGPQYAEALARAGIEGIQELKTRSAAKIAKQVNDYLDTLDSNVIGTGITEKRVAGWQAKAKKMRRVRMKVPES